MQEGNPIVGVKVEIGNKGFQPQSKPPVHTGGFDLVCQACAHSLGLKF
ncbi:hypothetical protein J32TS6_31770 [Virgibacillus pantothenticus]|nr:hypothetical protein J32TS6_31770 [Virgibacillus pantothenticus]